MRQRTTIANQDTEARRRATRSLRSVAAISGLAVAALLASCASPPPPPPPAPPPPPPPVAIQAPAAQPPVASPQIVSDATNPRAYRRDGAHHIYSKNMNRIFKGKMPPLLLGVGTMQLQLNGMGEIVAFNWLRPPSNAGAKAEIERTILAAAPYPAPVRLGGVTYIDTWLWDKSGQFQLDTLTDGQR